MKKKFKNLHEAKEFKKAVTKFADALYEQMNSNIQGSSYTPEDIIEAIHYLDEYYSEFPEEEGNYPNWGEIDNYFSDDSFCEALMNGEDDPAIEVVDNIVHIFYAS